MATNVTVLGAADAVVSVPFTTDANALIAQALAEAITQSVLQGTLTQINLDGTTAPTVSTPYAGIVETVPGGTGGIAVSLGTQFVSVVDNTSGSAVFESAVGTTNATVIAGGSAMSFFNQGTNTSAMFGGGSNSFIESDPAASGRVNVDGSAYVGATEGATIVDVFDGSVLDIAGGGQTTVNAESGTETIFVTGSSTVPVDIIATGSGLIVNAQGGAAMINPEATNVTVFGSASGSATVFGATSLTGGSGDLSVFGGSGYYVGGSGGGNILETSTVTGAATLVGGIGTDSMYSFASGNVLKETTGSDLMVAYNGGDTLTAGTGTSTMYGANTGNNTFVFDGAGTSTAYGAYGNATVGANIYLDSVGGGTITINDFRTGTDIFEIQGSASVTSNTFSGSGIPHSTVALSDGTTITFNYTAVSASDFRNV